MKSTRQIKIGFLASALATAFLLGVHYLFGQWMSDIVGFGLLVGFSYATLCK
ncbi:MAG: hypothetical protein WCC10_01095 [Tumebacillaceae bacterium]